MHAEGAHDVVELPFANRAAAGQALAQAVQRSVAGIELIFGLPRGGVAVGAEIASDLNVPLDVFLVRKVGAPGQPELAMGALAETGHIEMNQSVLDRLQVADDVFKAVIEAERREIERRLEHYREGRPAPDVQGRRVVVVDDGVATGATTLVALRALRAQRPAYLVLAVPVCPRPVLNRLESESDQVVVLATPHPF